MPWYKLPHADMVMHFDQEMDMEPADAPVRPDVTTDDDEPHFMPKPKHWHWPKPAPKEETEAT